MPVQKREFIKLRDQSLVKQIKRLAKESHTNPSAWVTEVVEEFIRDHRSRKPFVGAPDRHTERHDDFDCGEYEVDLYERKASCA